VHGGGEAAEDEQRCQAEEHGTFSEECDPTSG
jgi:hypothetical protein